MLATTPILVRLAQHEGLPALTVANLRLLSAVTLLAPFALGGYRAEMRQLTRRELVLIGLGGMAIALFYMFFFSSLAYTSVLISGVLTGTNPLWVALMEIAFLKSRLTRNLWLGLALALAGSALFALAGNGTLDTGDQPLLGGALALVAAVMTAVYYVVGCRVRARVSALPFLWLVLMTGAVMALLIAALTHTALTGYRAQGYVGALLLTFGPQISRPGFHYLFAGPSIADAGGYRTAIGQRPQHRAGRFHLSGTA